MKKARESSKLVFYVVIVIIILVNLYILILNYQTAKSLSEIQNVQEQSNIEYEVQPLNISNNPLSIEGFTQANITLSNKAVIVSANCTAIGLVVHEFQLYSIKQGLEKSIDIRPTIHDTIRGILDNFNISVMLVKITDAKDDLYFSNIYLKKDNNILSIDAKPSDAIAIAVREKAPVYVNNSVLEEFGENVC